MRRIAIKRNFSYRSAIEHSPTMILVLRSDGRIELENRTTKRILGVETRVGLNFFDFVHPDDLQMVRTALAEKAAELTCRLRHASRDWIPLESRITHGNTVVMYSRMQDVASLTELQYAREFQDKLKLLQRVSLELTAAESLDELCKLAIGLGHIVLGYDRIGMGIFEPADRTRFNGYSIGESGELQVTMGDAFNPDDPNISTVLVSSDAIFVSEDAELFDRFHNVVGHGWNIVAGIWDSHTSIGWLAADNLLMQQPLIPYQVELFKLYGQTIGHLITRKRIEEALQKSEQIAKEFQEKLRVLHGIGLELSAVPTIDQFFYAAVALGVERLGFERLGLTLIDDDHTMAGTYGTDESGAVRDEKDLKIKLADDSPELQLISHGVGADYWDDVELLGYGKVVGRGWNARGVLWNGTKGIGLLATDNYLSHQPARPYTVDLLGLYANLIGNLLTQKRTEATLRQREEYALEFQNKLKALQEISIQLANAGSLQDLCRNAIEFGHHVLEFDRIGVLVFDNPEKTKVSRYGIESDGNIHIEQGMNYVIEADDVMANYIKTNESIYVNEDADLYNFSGKVGRGWNIVSVIQNGNISVGWIAADNFFEKKPLIPYQVELLQLYGLTLGHLITRARVEAALRESERIAREFQDKLRALHELGLELSAISEIDEFFYQAVHLGIRRLGIERCGLLLIDERQNLIGTYGTDEHGNVHNVSHVRIKLAENSRELQLVNHGMGAGFWDDVDLMSDGRVVGRGWNVLAVLWDGSKGIGIIATDNHLYHQPPPPYILDLMSLYGNLLGRLLSQKRDRAEIQALNLDLREQMRRLSILNDISHHVSMLAQLDSVLRKALEKLRTVLPLDTFFVVLRGESPGEFVHPLSYENGRFLQIPPPLDDYPILNLVIEGRVSIMVNRTPEGARRISKSILCAPLPLGDQVIGAIAAYTYQAAAYDETHRDLLTAVAYQIATAINNAQLYDTLHKELEERKQAQNEVRSLNAELEQRVSQRTAQLEAANHELEAFTYSVSHDLRAPIRAIDGFSRTLNQTYRADLPDKARHYLDRIQHNTQRMGHLIDDLLALSRIGKRELLIEPIDMHQLVREAWEETTADIKVGNVEFIVQPLPSGKGDRALLKLVWINLLSNALKYSSKCEHPKIEITHITQNNDVVYLIKDNGAGFDMQYADKLFGVFQRLHSSDEYEGTGIGLATIHRIIGRHGGRVWADAKVNQGATFYFTIGDSHG